MSSSSTSNVIGASKHNAKNTWTGAFAFSNIGLPGAAFRGKGWLKKHAGNLRELLSNLLMTEQKLQGILLCEVGNVSDPITLEYREQFEVELKFAFEDTGGVSLHGPPQFFWSNTETMAAFKAETQVQVMEPLTKMSQVDDWRTVERFKVIGATEHGQHTLLMYNQHQPNSEQPTSNKITPTSMKIK